MDGLLLFIGVCILNSLRQLVEYYFSQGLTKPVLTISIDIPERFPVRLVPIPTTFVAQAHDTSHIETDLPSPHSCHYTPPIVYVGLSQIVPSLHRQIPQYSG